MKAHDLIELAGRNLREAVLRNSLTTLGISVGVASLVAMLSLGVGLQAMADKRLAKSGLFDTIVVTSRRDIRRFNRPEARNAPPPAESRPLDENARLELERIPDVLEAVPDIRFITELRYDDKPHLNMVAGLPQSAKDRDAFDTIQGTYFSSPTASEAILQKEFADELLGARDTPTHPSNITLDQTKTLIGKNLILRYGERTSTPVATAPVVPTKAEAHSGRGVPASPRKAEANSSPMDGDNSSPMVGYSVIPRQAILRIVGITDQDPDSMRGQGRARVFIPLRFAENMHVMLPNDLRENTRGLSSVQTYSTLSVRAQDPNQVQSIQDAIKKMGFNTFSILDATRSLRRFFAVLDVFLGIFGSLALAVSSIGIVNTLVMAILERRRDIGIMKAIGASDGDVKKLFFAEAGVMGMLGGFVGVGLGWGIGRAINFGTNIYLHSQDLPSENLWSVPWWLVLGAIAFSISVSMISGLYPAARAARLDPVKALRYE
ncbi:MAG TPA: FtsX-like permease family protein [Terriglobia bacterium]|nr:FtsX-like permease family protein [Terriglobia bacterium]